MQWIYRPVANTLVRKCRYSTKGPFKEFYLNIRKELLN